MANYADYVKEDGIEAEIDEAAEQQQARDEKGRFIPERFRDKDVTEVIKSYEELEKLNSRQAQDLGQMRKQVDQLIELSTQSASPAAEEAKPLSVDDLYENPDEAVRRIAHEVASKEVSELRNALTTLQQEKVISELDGKFPDWQNVSQSSEFSEWVRQSPYRQTMAVAVQESGDLAAAQELLGMYYDQNSSKAEEQAQSEKQEKVQKQLRDATLESSSPAPVSPTDTFSRNDLLEARLAAKAGDRKAERWLAANSVAISNAYAEGRIVD